jgi:hypothetical protein
MAILLVIQAAGAAICGGLAWHNGIANDRPRLASLCGLAFIAWIVLFFFTLGRV